LSATPHRYESPEPIGLLVADDDPFVRSGVRAIVARTGRFRIAAEVGTGEEILDALSRHDVDCLLVDVNMPGPGAVEITRRVKRRHPEVRVLFFSIRTYDGYALQVMRAGADGFISKEHAFSSLPDALETVARGERYLESELAKRLVSRAASGPSLDLSEREVEVLRQLVAGHRVTEIAATLGVSPKTVSTYRTRILRKTDLHSTAELVHFALHNRLVEGP